MSSMEINQVLAQIRSLSAQTKSHGAPGVGSLGQGIGALNPGGPTPSAPSDFSKLLSKGLDQVNSTQKTASSLAQAFERGVPGVELPQVMLEMQKASVSFRAATEVRNRLISAYQEIMNMPI